jgi:glycosyltransferase involved in cell wall biosynthesis
MESKLRVFLITYPFLSRYPNYYIIMDKYICIFSSIFNRLYVILGSIYSPKCNKNVEIKYCGSFKHEKNVFNFLMQHILAEIRTVILLLRNRNEYDLVIFLAGEPILTSFASKLLKKEIIFLPQTSAPIGVKNAHGRNSKVLGNLFYVFYKLFEGLNFYLSDKIVLNSPKIAESLHLDVKKDKIILNNPIFVDTQRFKIQEKYNQRKELIGYIGRLSSEKGIINFLKTIKYVSDKHKNLEFFIGGDGSLKDEVISYIADNDLNKVKFAGWISHDDLPGYLNELKLLVVPSYIEGLPNIMLEAMACGTPVLITPVGGVSDVIKDEKTGFIMQDNSPGCIEKNIFRALNFHNMDEIVLNSRKLIEDKYSFKAALERFQIVLGEIKC